MSDPLLDQLGDLAGHQREGRTIRALIETDLTPERRAALDHTAMVLLRRGVAESGHAAAATERLERHGCEVAAIRLFRMTPALFDHLYRIRAVLFGDNWWVHHRIVDGHPVAGLLLRGDPGGFESLSLRLNAAKGASSPAAVDDSGLRAALGRPTSFHPLIHLAATSSAVVYESVMFDWSEVLGVLDGDSRPARAELLLPCLDVASERFSTVHALARRVAWCAAGIIVAQAPELGDLAERIRSTLAHPTSAAGFGPARDDHLAAALAVRDDLAELVERAHRATVEAVGELPVRSSSGVVRDAFAPSRLALAMEHLLGLVECPGWEVEATLNRLVDHGIALRDDHRHWLLAGLRNDLNPHAVFGGLRQYPLPDA